MRITREQVVAALAQMGLDAGKVVEVRISRKSVLVEKALGVDSPYAQSWQEYRIREDEEADQ